MVGKRLTLVALSLAAMVGLGAYLIVLQPLWNTSGRFHTAQNAVANGDFGDPSGITYVHSFRLGPIYFCPSQSGNASLLSHKWGMLHVENDLMLGNRSKSIYGISTVDSRNAFLAGISAGEGGRISLLQQLGSTTVNSSTRIHFSVDSRNSTSQVYSSIIIVLGPIWRPSNNSFSQGYVVIFKLDKLPNMSGWYDFDFSLSKLLQGLTGKDVIGSTFGGPCLSSRGVALGLETASFLERGVFSPSPALSLALTDVAVYDSASGHDTMFNGQRFSYILNDTASGSESNVPVTSYILSFPHS